MAVIAAGRTVGLRDDAAGRSVVRTSLGVLWAMVHNGGDVEFHYSTNDGASWTEDTAAQRNGTEGYGLHCADDDTLHARTGSGGGDVKYLYGQLNGSHTQVTWSSRSLSSGYRDGDVVGYSLGGYRWGLILNASGVSVSMWLSRYRDGSSYDTIGTSTAAGTAQQITLDFHHNGDGRTVVGGTPHLYAAWRDQSTCRFRKAAYAGGTYSWGTLRTLRGSGVTDVHDGAFDGSRMLVLIESSGGALEVLERDAADTATAVRAVPALTGTPVDASVSYDEATGNIYVAAVDGGDSDLKVVVYDRGAASWGAWSTVAAGTFLRGSLQRGNRANTAGSRVIDSVYHDAANGHHAVAVAINRPPTVTLSSPANGAFLNMSDAQTFTALYSDPDGDPSGGWAYRIKPSGGGYQYWNGSALVGTKQWNAGSPSFVLPGGSVSNGQDYNWSFDVRDDSLVEAGFAADRTLTATNPPTLTVDAPADPVTDTTQPETAWTFTSPDLEAQATWQHKLFTAAQFGAPGFDPETSAAVYDSAVQVGGDASDTPTVHLTNGTTYRAYVHATDALGQPTGWEYREYTVTLTPPAAATIAVTVDNAVLRAQLDVAGNHDTGVWPTAYARAERLDPDGVWRTVIGGAAALYDATPETTVVDEELTPGFQHSWRVFTDGEGASGQKIASAASNTVTGTAVAVRDWLKDPYDWSASVAVDIAALNPADPSDDGVFRVLDRADAVVVGDAARLVSGSVTFQTETRADREALLGRMASGRTLLLAVAPDVSGEQGELWWLRFHGERQRVRLAQTRTPFRRVTQAFERQSRPTDVV